MKLRILLFKLMFFAMAMSLQLKFLQWRHSRTQKQPVLDDIEWFALTGMTMSLLAGGTIAWITLSDPSRWTPMLDLIGGMSFVSAGIFILLGAQHACQKTDKILGTPAGEISLHCMAGHVSAIF